MTTDFRPQTSDPTDDLARGKRHLRRRRTALLGGVAVAALLVGGAVPLAVNLAGSDADTKPRTLAEKPVQPTSEKPVSQQVTLVSYTGKQPKGYKVSWIPDGWVIQGSTPGSLTIAPKDAKDKDPNSFVGKLTVLSASNDQPKDTLTQGTPVPMGDRTGYLVEPETDGSDPELMVFNYQDVSGRWVQLQVPDALHWDGAQIAKFAQGITVVNGAGDTHG